jgi:heme A synthase
VSAVEGRRIDERVWSVATVASVVVVQFVLGAVAVVFRLLGGSSFAQRDVVENFRTSLLTASGIVLAVALVIGAVLFTRPSPTVRGVGLSVGASGVVIAIVGALYVFWIY